MRDDLNILKDHLTETIKNMVAVTSTIFTEYLNVFQRKLTADYLKLLNDETYNVYDMDARRTLELVARRESDDFLKYKGFFMDFSKLTDFTNNNVELKKKFIQQNFKFNIADHITVSSYMDLLNKNIDSLADFSSEVMQKYKMNEINKASSSKYLQAISNKEMPRSAYMGTVATSLNSLRPGAGELSRS